MMYFCNSTVFKLRLFKFERVLTLIQFVQHCLRLYYLIATGDSHKIDSSLSTTDADINMNTKPAEKPTPDATNWLVADVVSFLNSLGFGEEAKSFEDQVCGDLLVKGGRLPLFACIYYL